jgi:hypothetical protein
MSNTFTWATKFKSIIIVDGELFSNEYSIKISLTPHTADLKEQTNYFERLKNLFEQVFANTITTWRDDPLYDLLKKKSTNRFIELPKPPYDQIMAAVCFCKANSILDSKIIINFVELSSWQGDGITYKVDKDSKELIHMMKNLTKAFTQDISVGTHMRFRLTRSTSTMLNYLSSNQRF